MSDTATAFDGSKVPATIKAPCGNTAVFDEHAGYGYVCQTCFMTVGSMLCPCPDMTDDAVTILSGLDEIRLGDGSS